MVCVGDVAGCAWNITIITITTSITIITIVTNGMCLWSLQADETHRVQAAVGDKGVRV